MTNNLGERLIGNSIDDYTCNFKLFSNIESTISLRLKKQPNDEKALLQLANCKRKLGKITEAVELYNELLKLNPSNLEYQFTVKALLGETKESLLNTTNLSLPSPIVREENFLSMKLIDQLLDYSSENQTNFRPALTMTKNGKRNDNARIRNNTELSLKSHPLKKTIRRKILPEITEIKRRLGIKEFKTGHIEIQLRAYHHGEYFSIHHDDMMKRRINFVYFFHPEPKRYCGGDLVIFDDESTKGVYGGNFTRIIPENNRIVFFPSHRLHLVTPTVPADDNFLSGRFVINGHVREE